MPTHKKRDYTPLLWSEYYDTRRIVETPNGKFCVYKKGNQGLYEVEVYIKVPLLPVVSMVLRTLCFFRTACCGTSRRRIFRSHMGIVL